jgi:beta-galactosidase
MPSNIRSTTDTRSSRRPAVDNPLRGVTCGRLTTQGDRPGINDKGLVTHDRQVRKDAFYWYKASWSDEPVTYITSRRWTDRTVPATTVKVYSNADEVRLHLNGESVGTKASDDHIFSWPVVLQPGDNTVVAESVIDGRTHTDRVTWTLTP